MSKESRDYQIETIANYEQWLDSSERIGSIVLPMGLGKAQPFSAKVFTPTGYKTIGDLVVGDLVFGVDGKPTVVTGIFDQGIKEIFKVTFSDNSYTHCCNDHLWEVNTPSRRFDKNQPMILSLGAIKDKLKYFSGNRKYFIPMVDPVQFQEQQLPLHPYLLGLLLGDGSITQAVGISTADSEIIEVAKSYLPKEHTIKYRSNYDYAIVKNKNCKKNEVKQALQNLKLFGKKSIDKWIPDIYKFNSIENRVAILQGLFDSAGHISSKTNAIEYSTSSPALSEDVKFLVESLGGTVSIRRRKTKCKDSFRMIISLCNEIIPFRLSRKINALKPRTKYNPSRSIDSVHSVGFESARCISVDHPRHLYVTDNFIVTHNTYTMVQCLSKRPDWNYLWVAHRQELIDQALETMSEELSSDFRISSEIADRKANLESNAIVASVQTLARDRVHLRGWKPNVIFIDEYHHFSEDNVQYNSLKKRWPDAKIVGASATLWRNDNAPIPLGKILMHMDILTAIEKGYLVNPVFEEISAYSLSSLKTLRLSSFLNPQEIIDDKMCERIIELVKEGRQGIMFGASTEHAKELFERLKDHVRAEQVYYDTPAGVRKEIMAKVRNKKVDCLVNYQIGVEGLNIPHLGFVAINRDTESLNIFQQMAGRGLRLADNKNDCVILTTSKCTRDDLKSSLDDVSYLNKNVEAFGYSSTLPKILNKTVKPILTGVLNKLIKV